MSLSTRKRTLSTGPSAAYVFGRSRPAAAKERSRSKARYAPTPFGPRGTTVQGEAHRLLDQLIRPLQHRRRERQAEGLGGLEVDDELELRGLLDRQVGGLGPLEDLVHIDRGAAEQVVEAGGLRDQTARFRMLSGLTHHRQVILE